MPAVLHAPPSTFTRASSAPRGGLLHTNAGNLQVDSIADECVWVVGVDGSRLSFRCLRLASMLMDTTGKDQLIVLHVSTHGEVSETSMLATNCQLEARRCNIPMKCFAFKSVPKVDKLSVADTIISYISNFAGNRARLVIGAQGMRTNGTAGTTSMDHIGGVAMECMLRIKVPVVIVKQPWGPEDGHRDSFSRVLRSGHNGHPGLNIYCCVDDSRVSRQAFTLATSITRQEDKLVALHVTKIARDAQSQDRERRFDEQYTKECASLPATFKNVRDAKYVAMRRTNNSVGDDIIETTEDEQADVIFVGTKELANPQNFQQLGSVCSHLAKFSRTHLCIVKHAQLQSC